MNMHIGQVISGYPDYYTSGGASRSAHSISEELANRGHEVDVFSTTLSDPDTDTAQISDRSSHGVQIHRSKLVSDTLGHRHKIPIARQFGRNIREGISDIDILHLHEFRTVQAYTASKVAAKNDTPVILQPRGSMPRMSKTSLKYIFDSTMSGSILSNSDRGIFSSSSEIDCVPKKFVNKLEEYSKIPNGIDLEEYSPSEQFPQTFEDHGVSKSTDVILFLSRVAERKGLNRLVESISDLLRDRDDIVLVVAGPDEGGLEPALTTAQDNGIADSVIYVGPVYGTEKIRLYSASTLFVLPSLDRYESFGNVILEALACGTPAVATDVCGVTEWIEADSLHVCSTDQQDLLRGIRQQLDTYSNRTDPCCETDIENFSWSEVTDQYEDVYESSVEVSQI